MRIKSRAMTAVGALLVGALWFRDGTAAPESVRVARAEKIVATSGVETLDRAIHEQSERLRRRLDTAPRPSTRRNPFEFVRTAPRAASPHRTTPDKPSAITLAPQQSEPELVLLGVAGNECEGLRTRIAVIGGSGEAIWMLEEGQMLGMQYRVTRIGEESAELTDVITGKTWRLLFR